MQSKEEKYFIYNHLSFTVKFHRDELTETARIVGFEVTPFRWVFLSIKVGKQAFQLLNFKLIYSFITIL